MRKYERVKKVNELILLISSLDRRFFYSEKSFNGTKNVVSRFSLQNGRIHFLDSYSLKVIKSFPDSKEWLGFSNSITLQLLIKQFVLFIRTGEPLTKLCYDNWYYSEQSIKKIENKMVELGFLIKEKEKTELQKIRELIYAKKKEIIELQNKELLLMLNVKNFKDGDTLVQKKSKGVKGEKDIKYVNCYITNSTLRGYRMKKDGSHKENSEIIHNLKTLTKEGSNDE